MIDNNITLDNTIEYDRFRMGKKVEANLKKQGLMIDEEVLEGFKKFYCKNEDDFGIIEHTYEEFSKWLKIWEETENKEVVFDIEVFDFTGYIEAFDHRSNIKHIFNF